MQSVADYHKLGPMQVASEEAAHRTVDCPVCGNTQHWQTAHNTPGLLILTTPGSSERLPVRALRLL